MRILVINCGSSSVKFALVNTQNKESIVAGLVENINSENGLFKVKYKGEEERIFLKRPDYNDAFTQIKNWLDNTGLLSEGLDGVGHRVVHGGEKFSGSVVINDEVMKALKDSAHLAPLHNPPNIQGILAARKLFPSLPQIGVFDTAFHQTIPQRAYIYPIPLELYEKHGVRKYGFHGTSHRYVVEQAAKALNKNLDQTALISAHLGNGCSAAAVLNGKSVDTTMGLTPLEGLMMGTRSGSIDPGLHSFLNETLGWDFKKINQVLNKESGLLGISGLSSDMRTLLNAALHGHNRALLAINIYCYHLAQSLAGLAVSLGRVDALIFTGGVGENSTLIRAKTLQLLKVLGFHLDIGLNEAHGKNSGGVITSGNGPMALVIPTNEELMIALDTEALVNRSVNNQCCSCAC